MCREEQKKMIKGQEVKLHGRWLRELGMPIKEKDCGEHDSCLHEGLSQRRKD